MRFVAFIIDRDAIKVADFAIPKCIELLKAVAVVDFINLMIHSWYKQQ
jgi:hypothetical protein